MGCLRPRCPSFFVFPRTGDLTLAGEIMIEVQCSFMPLDCRLSRVDQNERKTVPAQNP
jgi:hypothetical protein